MKLYIVYYLRNLNLTHIFLLFNIFLANIQILSRLHIYLYTKYRSVISLRNWNEILCSRLIISVGRLQIADDTISRTAAITQWAKKICIVNHIIVLSCFSSCFFFFFFVEPSFNYDNGKCLNSQ